MKARTWYYLLFSVIFVFMESIVLNEDCMAVMALYPDKYFDLAVVDPPYGIGMDGTIGIGVDKEKGFTRKKEYTKKNWDKEVPSQEYFDELFRISKNQIVWGANYFTKQLPIIKNFIFWHKKGHSIDDKFNDGEIAFTSLGRTRMIDIWWNGFGSINSGEKRIHPTQKPISLYNWIYHNYLPQGGKVIDTHLGSGSNRISADKAGNIDFIGCELDKDYFEAQEKRWRDYKAQLTLF